MIPGYANWNEMTRDAAVVENVKDLLGDAWADILRPNWNWSPLDVFGSTHRSRSLLELNVRQSISRGRVVTLYLTDGVKEAHSKCWRMPYEVLGDRTSYLVYDSNHPAAPTRMDFLYAEARFDHPDLGLRDPWILHPYADEFTSTRAYLQRVADAR